MIDLLREAFVDDTLPTLDEVVARIRALPRNPANFRPAIGSLADVLAETKDADFDLAAWEAEWARVEAEMAAMDLADEQEDRRREALYVRQWHQHPRKESPMPWTFDLVAGPYSFTEGPVWTGETLLFTDIRTSRIMRYDPATGECDEFDADTNAANGLHIDRQGNLYVCEGGGRRVVRYEWDGDKVVIVDSFEGHRLNSPNDITSDAQGRLWFTDPRYGEKRDDMELDHESVFRLDPPADGAGAWAITRVTFDTTRPNGLVFSPDGGTLYVAESPPAPHGARQLRAYPVNVDGSLGAMRVLHDFGPHRGIDGMRTDAEGNIVASCGWSESGPGPRIGIFAPDGTVLEDHPTPTNPTNCAFGDDDRRTLYVTGYDGCLYRARTDRQG